MSGLKFALVASFALTATAPLAACGPTIFEDASALSVVGDPPPPPPKPKVVQEKPKRVVVEENRIKINEKIEFDFNKATIRPESDGLMTEIISVIKENPTSRRSRSRVTPRARAATSTTSSCPTSAPRP
ncbi:hypothetical protein [Nannocystis pusilla]|uniref:hypothetical protein n=1 Tax=Nannocystis pusilla TaxID=889268 RepID=UPI003B8281E9